MIFSLARLSLRRGLFLEDMKEVRKQVIQIFLGKRILDRENSMCNGPEAGTNLMFLRNKGE